MTDIVAAEAVARIADVNMKVGIVDNRTVVANMGDMMTVAGDMVVGIEVALAVEEDMVLRDVWRNSLALT